MGAEKSAPRIALIVAMATNRVIGRDGGIPWDLPADRRYFRRVTMGRPIVMGRKTHESIGRPLPGRQNIVLSSQRDLTIEGCDVVPSIEAALAAAEGATDVMIIGGRAVYEAFMPMAQTLYLTFIDEVFEGDVFFPDFEPSQWREIMREAYEPDDKNPYHFQFVTLERRQPAD